VLYPKIKVPVLQNRVFDSEQAAIGSDFGYLQIEQNPETGIVENRLFDANKIVYDQNYDNEQSYSRVFEEHLEHVCDILAPYIRGDKKVIEVGCGKGHFFRKLASRNIDIIGCDPTYEGDDPRIIKELFSEELGLKGDVIVLRHVLEHIQDPVSFIKSIAAANGNKGIIYIEVPDLNWIVKNQVFFDFFYEHVNYFRPADFKRIFNKTYELNTFFNGQYQYVIADLGSINNPPYTFEKNEDEIKVSFDNLDKIGNLIRQSDRPVYIWGAASKGVISSMHLLLRGIRITALVDINPKKQNRYAAMTGIKIISPETFRQQGNKAILLIANPNYEAEIRRELSGMDLLCQNL
jgi:2-polyprenyl-3-methyl-5-hydroxy-6-metoxy-1,4-benzoquinol methylase